MTIAYFDCFSGAGGDMIVAALLDAGANADELRARLAPFHEPTAHGFTLHVEKIKKQGFAATRFRVDLNKEIKQPHRHLKHVVQIISAASLPTLVAERAIAIFTRLAEAEAKVHGSTVEKVHFHEVGAIDAIIDVVGTVTVLDLLGVERVICSAIPVGSGTIKCDHGIMPVPAPATAELLRGVPIASCDEVSELTTPTAAAILTTLAESFGPIPAMNIRSIGYGAGTRDGVTRPNVLRVLIGDAVESANEYLTDQVAVLESNLDDATPQAIGFCSERLLAAGAWDVFSVPIQMKKHRPGVMLTVLCAPTDVATMERIIFSETPTLGIRRRMEDRAKLNRRIETVQTKFGPIRVKIGEANDVRTVAPEYEDCKVAALQHNVPLQAVMEAARRTLSAI